MALRTSDPAPPTENHNLAVLINSLKPKEVVDQLDKYIVGQADAKKAVAVAFRTRWRRQQLSQEMKNEIVPKNILMIGPTGCGKTEIARRVAKLSDSPFIKVEATKFTEVGYHGRDVDTIIKDLVDISYTMTRKRIQTQIKGAVEQSIEDRILEALLSRDAPSSEVDKYRDQLRTGIMEELPIELEVPRESGGKSQGSTSIATRKSSSGVMSLEGLSGSSKRRMSISEARVVLEEMETDRLLEQRDLAKEAIHAVEQSGIVFIDEIDKIVSSRESFRGADASAEGVQRDLLPIIEGSVVNTKHGDVSTDYVLFICAGAFHHSKPSDLLPELQGRLPIKVQLKGLNEEDLHRILVEPVSNLINQQVSLMRSENVNLTFTPDAIREVAKTAFEVNRTIENIGARRLHTVLEKVVEEISFSAPDKAGEEIVIDAAYVKERTSHLLKATDLKKYIL